MAKENETQTPDLASKNQAAGVFYILLSAFAFALMSVFVRSAGTLPAAQKALFRNLVSFTVALIVLLRHQAGKPAEQKQKEKQQGFWKRHPWGSLLLRAGFGTAGVLANFYAIDHLPLADANSLNKLSPFFAVLASAIILGELIRRYQLVSLLTAFFGALLILRPDLSNFSFQPAHLIAVTSAICAGIAYTYVRKLGLLNEDSAFIVFFFSFFSIVVFLPLTLANWTPMSWRQLGFLLLAGVAASFGQLGVTLGYRHAPARSISVYNYAQVPFAALLGLILFQEVPDLLSVLGYAIIIGAALYMFFKEKKQHAAA